MEYTFSEAQAKIYDLLNSHESFTIVGLGGKMLEASKFIENAIESQGLKCRVFTRKRALAAGAMAWSPMGLYSLAAIAAHDLITFHPHYEIGRAIVDNKLYVECTKRGRNR